MKKKLHLLLLVVLAVAACKKSPFDYRNQYIGNYNFTNIYSSVDSLGVVSNSTVTFFGKAKTEGDDKMVIEFETNKSQALRIDKDGNVYDTCDKYVGQFVDASRFQSVFKKQDCLTIDFGTSSTITIVGDRQY